MKIVLTGAEGFLGRHTRRPLEAVGGHEVVPVGRRDFDELESVADGRTIERFVVLSGCARIAVHRLFTDDILTFHVNSDEPVAADIPTTGAHNISNTASDELLTVFWTDKVFDPGDPNAIPRPVGDREVAVER